MYCTRTQGHNMHMHMHTCAYTRAHAHTPAHIHTHTTAPEERQVPHFEALLLFVGSAPSGFCCACLGLDTAPPVRASRPRQAGKCALGRQAGWLQVKHGWGCCGASIGGKARGRSRCVGRCAGATKAPLCRGGPVLPLRRGAPFPQGRLPNPPFRRGCYHTPIPP